MIFGLKEFFVIKIRVYMSIILEITTLPNKQINTWYV